MKTKTMIFLMVLSATITAQTIIKYDDVMSGKKYTYIEEDCIVNGKEGFNINVFFENDKITMLMVNSFNLGVCVENGKLIIMLEDSTKLNFTAFNKYNCKGLYAFFLNDEILDKITKSPLLLIRLQNGLNFETITGTPDNKDYFIKIKYNLENKIFTEKK